MIARLLGLFVCVVLLTAATCGVQCAPSFRGYTGLVVIPTADTLNSGEFNFGVMTEDTGQFNANDIFTNYGPTDNLEVGFDSHLGIDQTERETLINAKYKFLPETEDKAGVAFGLIDLTNEIQSTAYAVASKSLVRRANIFDSDVTSIRGHIGIGGGRLNGLFFGLSAFAGNRVMFSFEWDSMDVNLGFRFTPMKGLRFHAALFDVGGRDDLGMGVSYSKNY